MLAYGESLLSTRDQRLRSCVLLLQHHEQLLVVTLTNNVAKLVLDIQNCSSFAVEMQCGDMAIRLELQSLSGDTLEDLVLNAATKASGWKGTSSTRRLVSAATTVSLYLNATALASSYQWEDGQGCCCAAACWVWRLLTAACWTARRPGLLFG